MSKISKTAILANTNYGTGIYAHILSKCFPEDEIVLNLIERDCGLCRNPFAEGAATLHIWIEKNNPGDAMSSELARHSATNHSIPDGDVFDFAERYYNLSGEELLSTINNELNLRIGAPCPWYLGTQTPGASSVTKEFVQNETRTDYYDNYWFSYYEGPIFNNKPSLVYSVSDAGNYIISEAAKVATEKLRSITTPKEAREFKARNFAYCTFSGIFSERSNNALIKHSGLLCLDFDHVHDVDSLRNKLLQDEYFETQLLFRSPSGDGVKWVIDIDIAKNTHEEWFKALSNYVYQTYGVEVDKSGKDVSRACFLPHDANCFVNNNLTKK